MFSSKQSKGQIIMFGTTTGASKFGSRIFGWNELAIRSSLFDHFLNSIKSLFSSFTTTGRAKVFPSS